MGEVKQSFLYPPVKEIGYKINSTRELEHLIDVLPEKELSEEIKKQTKTITRDRIWQHARDNFKTEGGEPWEMSLGELAMYKAIVLRQAPRIQVVSSTQFGKTLTISRAVLTRITTYPEDWLLVVPDTKRGRIFLNYIIKDTAENENFKKRLVGTNLGERDSLNRLLEEKSKTKLTYSIFSKDNPGGVSYGSITLISADARKKQNVIDTIMGFGGRNIIQEEAALTEDEIDAGVFRMLGGKGTDTFLCKIGNPFYRNHFLSTWKNPLYKKIYIDYKIGLAEGRYLPSFIEEAKGKPKFDVLFECKFPPQEAVDSEGWIPLLTEDEVNFAIQEGVHFGEERLGADPSGEGVDKSVIVKRSSGFAEVIFKSDRIDEMAFAGQIKIMADGFNSSKRYIDKIGIGAGIYKRLLEQRFLIKGVNAQERATEPAKFYNKRAEMYWRLRQWIKEGGKLSEETDWLQLCDIKYKADSRGRLKIMSKDEMRKQGIASPDACDALALTFYDNERPQVLSEEERIFNKRMREKKRKKKNSKGLSLKMTR